MCRVSDSQLAKKNILFTRIYVFPKLGKRGVIIIHCNKLRNSHKLCLITDMYRELIYLLKSVLLFTMAIIPQEI